MDILITEDINGKALEGLKEKYSIEKNNDLWKDTEGLIEKVQDVKAIIVRNQTKVDKNVLENACSLKVIGRAGVGLDNIDIEYASEKGIVVCYTPDGNTIAVAELTIDLMLTLSRKIIHGDKSTKSGNWDRMGHLGVELYNKTLGIIGLGKIGRAVASRAQAFGMKVLVNDKYLDRSKCLEGLNYELKSLEDLLSLSDVVTIHLPLNKETRNLLNNKTLSLMKSGSLLINTARGSIVNENELVKALERGTIKGAALDVRENEPPVKSKLNDFDNVILTPHIGGLTFESQERVINSVACDIDLVLSGKPAINYVNFAAPKINGNITN